MSIQSYINSPFNKGGSSTTPATPAPALTIVNAKTEPVSGFIKEMAATPGGAIAKVDALFDLAGVVQTLYVPAGIYNATIYVPIVPTAADGYIGTVQAVVVNTATNAAVLTSNTVSFSGGAATDYEALIFDTEDLITIPADINVKLQVWYGNSTSIFQVVNKTNPFDASASARWNPYLSFKSFKLPLVPPLPAL